MQRGGLQRQRVPTFAAPELGTRLPTKTLVRLMFRLQSNLCLHVRRRIFRRRVNVLPRYAGLSSCSNGSPNATIKVATPRATAPNQKASDPTCWLARRPASIGRAYCDDFRERMARAAIESCRGIKLRSDLRVHQHRVDRVQRFRETGSVEPDQISGNKPKEIAGSHRETQMQRCRTILTCASLIASQSGTIGSSAKCRVAVAPCNRG